jgi:hypothetical protein
MQPENRVAGRRKGKGVNLERSDRTPIAPKGGQQNAVIYSGRNYLRLATFKSSRKISR